MSWLSTFWVSRLLKLVIGLVEIGVGHGEVTARSCVVEMGVDSAWLDFGSSGVFFFFFCLL